MTKEWNLLACDQSSYAVSLLAKYTRKDDGQLYGRIYLIVRERRFILVLLLMKT